PPRTSRGPAVTALAPVLQAFFTDRLIAQRNASPHTIAGYRDTYRLLLTFATAQTRKQPSALDISDLDAPLIGAFLSYLERARGATPPAPATGGRPRSPPCSDTPRYGTPSTRPSSSESWPSRPSDTSATSSAGSPSRKPTHYWPHPTAAPGPGGAITQCSSS